MYVAPVSLPPANTSHQVEVSQPASKIDLETTTKKVCDFYMLSLKMTFECLASNLENFDQLDPSDYEDLKAYNETPESYMQALQIKSAFNLKKFLDDPNSYNKIFKEFENNPQHLALSLEKTIENFQKITSDDLFDASSEPQTLELCTKIINEAELLLSELKSKPLSQIIISSE